MPITAFERAPMPSSLYTWLDEKLRCVGNNLNLSGNETRKSSSSFVASLFELSQVMRIYGLKKSFLCFGAN